MQKNQKKIASGAYQLATAPAFSAKATIIRLRRLRDNFNKEEAQ